MIEIGIVANPHSRLNRRDPEVISSLQALLGNRGIIEKTQSISAITGIAQKFCRLSVPVVGINGGDGSIMSALTAFVKVYAEAGKPLPHFALLRGGTMNVLANNLRISGRPETLLKTFLKKSPDKLQLKPLTSLRVRTLEEEQYGFLFGSGLAPRFLEMYYRVKSDAWGAALTASKLYFSYFFHQRFFKSIVRTEPLHLQVNGKDLDLQSTCLLAATIKKMPLGFALFPHTEDHQGLIQGVNFPYTWRTIFWYLPFSLLSNRAENFLGKTSFTGASAEIALPGESTPYTLDGELFNASSGKIHLQTGPQVNFVIL